MAPCCPRCLVQSGGDFEILQNLAPSAFLMYCACLCSHTCHTALFGFPEQSYLHVFLNAICEISFISIQIHIAYPEPLGINYCLLCLLYFAYSSTIVLFILLYIMVSCLPAALQNVSSLRAATEFYSLLYSCSLHHTGLYRFLMNVSK